MKAWQIAVVAGALLIVTAIGVSFLFFNKSENVVATVNGVEIPEAEVEHQLEIMKEQQAQLLEGPGGKKREERFRAQILDFLVNAELIKQEANRIGIKVSDKEVDKRFKQVGGLFPDKKFEQALSDQKLTEDGLRDKIRDQVIAEKMMERITKEIKIGEDQMKDYFKKNEDQFTKAGQQKQLSFNDVKDQIEQTLIRNEQQTNFAALLERLKKDAKIEVN